MAKEKRQKDFIQQPVFPGGQKGLTDFIYSRLKYPEAALKVRAEGIVLVEYDIDFQGKVVATRVLQSVGHGCDEEACRVVKMLQFKVAKNRGVKVIFHQKAKIKFTPPPVQSIAPAPPVGAQQPQQIQYTFTVTTTTAPAPEQTQQQLNYNYTITIGPEKK